MQLGTVTELWQYPVKSLQGIVRDSVDVVASGIVDDRRWALIDGNGRLCSAKRHSKLFEAVGRPDGAVQLPDGTVTRDDSVISGWLGSEIRLMERDADTQVEFEMTFEPPNDDAEFIQWPAPAGTFFDLAALHIISTATLEHCRSLRPELDWNIRRYRPNIVIDVDVEPFGEDAWAGTDVQIGGATIRVDSPTIRCAMPLRAQPGGIERQPELFHALDAIHNNFLGVYCSVTSPGSIKLGDAVTRT